MTAPEEPIAIIGTGCRFPGSSSSPSKLWDLLRNPHNVATKVPKNRFNIDAFYHPDGSHRGTTNVEESYFLSEDIARFDAPFFNISASEAGNIDPQQRLLLETVYESLEAAGIPIHTLQNSATGVFCGTMNDDWSQLLAFDDKAIPHYSATGIARTNLANRVSYFFNWHGPSFTIDTACSSSMVALHQAVYSLRARESALAVVTGANLIFAPNMYISASNMHMLSPTGRCRMWDDQADGYARGEGVASIVLKRLSDAIRDGDPIECVVRATGTNQDGRTMGLTMPSSDAQHELIKATYAAAGLDPVNRPQDRCQYFEAHGTGTHAGDPQEAYAIYRSFFPPSSSQALDDNDKLYVGSIKTVIGHTEGTAGIAGIIKASLCIQNGTIVPNLHFNCPNPEVLPYTSRLSVATNTIPWPELPPGTPRRVSVNSFGFGGANAHAILESYEPELHAPNGLTNGLSTKSNVPSVLPFVFSAASEQTLATLLENFIRYLEENPKTHPGNLSWSLLHRRSVFPNRLILWAATIDTLQDKIRESLRQRSKDSPLSTTVTRLTTGPKQVLGIFTGQGAQWPQMALDLITSSPQTLKWLDDLQASLDQLPEKYRPDFSLLDELVAPESNSRIAEPIISQTLCTAVQIVQVKLLSTLGISFSSVIGHSSGEIAAAYASGSLSESDAIRIAYLRGWVVSNKPGQSGAMMAAGLSLEEATDICSKAPYKGRATLAASNSPSSVTLSGDKDAIKELEEQLKKESRFARLLRVNTAYHSHHMGAYSGEYLEALKAANIQPGPLGESTKWYSSVHNGGQIIDSAHRASLAGEYWKDNMVNPVLFSQALMEAASSEAGLPDLIIEVGPHHALKGPALQTLGNLNPLASNIPYVSLSSRGISGIATVAEAIGSFWAYLGPDSTNTVDYVKLFDASYSPKVAKDLPNYPFDRQVHWFESRWSRSRWHARYPPHPLLGSLSPDTTEGEWRWRNYLRREELEWLDGHQVQNQTIFPATGYIALAVEASKIVAQDLQRDLQLVQVHHLVIDHAISISDANGTEIFCSLGQVESGDDSLSGALSVFVAEGDNLKKCVSGKVVVSWGEEDAGILPSKSTVAARADGVAGSTKIDVKEFYQHLARLGYGYEGPFRSMVSIQRKGDLSSGELANQVDSPFVVHPAVMDTGLQALFAALEAPGDGLLTTLHIPTCIETTTINPNAFGPASTLVNGTGAAKMSSLFFDAAISDFKPGGFGGDIDLFTSEGNLLVQFEGVQVSPLVPPTAANDRLLFSEVAWGPLQPDAKWEYNPPPAEWYEKIALPDHIGFWYMKEVSSQLTEEDRQKLDWHKSRIVAWMDHVLSLTRAGKHPVCKKEWFDETREDVDLLIEKAGGIDAIMSRTVGENLLSFLRGEVTMLEVLRKDDILGRFYKNAAETLVMNAHLGDIVKQIAFRFPRMKILELGAGTGSATNTVLKRIGRSYHSYTFTDISAGFFEEAQNAFAEHDDQFIYKVLDVEQDPKAQGFEEYSYDLIIAANVLHATKSLEQTMHRVRRLLKPGGRLVALEGVNLDIIRITFIICGFEGWWLGEKDGRPFGALVDQAEWDRLLRKTGFNGFETITPMDDHKEGAYAVFVAQADDDRMRRLREPLAIPAVPATNGTTKSPDLVLVGGASEKGASLVSTLKKTLARHFSRVIHASTLEELSSSQESSAPVVLNLADVDEPVFQNLTQKRLNALKTIVSKAQKLLWVNVGSEAENPHLSMSRGFLNSLRYEQPQCLFQHLNVVKPEDADATLIATTLMRLAHTDFANDYALPEGVESIEPDLRFEDGILKISRIQPGSGTNQRYNANRRAIQGPVDLDKSIVRVNSANGAWSLVEDKPLTDQDSSRVRVSVTHSTLAAIKIPGAGFLHLVVGRNAQTGARALALSDQHASAISTPASWYWELLSTGILADLDDATLLQTATSAVLAQSLLDSTVPGSALLVHEADKVLQRAIKVQAVARGVRPYFTTSSKSEAAKEPETLYLHRWSSNRTLAAQIPSGVSTTARFDKEGNSVFSRVEALLPGVARADIGTLIRPSALLSQQYEVHRVATTLQIANGLVSQLADGSNTIDTIRIETVPETPVDVLKAGPQIVDWTDTQTLPVSVQSASSQINLSAQKTYLLVGIANDLGQSVAQWMISRGARNVVLTSRAPKIEQSWVEEMAKLGARVVPLAM